MHRGRAGCSTQPWHACSTACSATRICSTGSSAQHEEHVPAVARVGVLHVPGAQEIGLSCRHLRALPSQVRIQVNVPEENKGRHGPAQLCPDDLQVGQGWHSDDG